MKKTLVSLVLLLAAFGSVIAQDKPKAGDLIYGTVTGSEGPLAGIVITERNHNDRIMAQTTTDINGNFAFRMVNPDHRIVITKGYFSVDIPVTRQHQEIDMSKITRPPVMTVDEILFGRAAGYSDMLSGDDEPILEMDHRRVNSIYIPFTNGNRYYSVEDLFNNWYPSYGNNFGF